MSDTSCIFCSIASGEVPSEIVAETKSAIAFKDINPVAPVHVLVAPRQHIPTLDDLDNPQIALQLLALAKEVGQEQSGELGYRILVNSKKQAEIPHLHVHVLGGLQPGDPLKGGDAA